MAKPVISIGMSHFSDFDGAYFSIQSLRLHNPEVAKRIELIVVENNPASKHAEMLHHLVTQKIPKETLAGIKHVTYHESMGTSQTRNAVFEHATGDFVMVMDCHVMFPAGVIQRLLDFYDEHPDTKDIYSGPLFQDSLLGLTCQAPPWTHFNDQWRGEMLGTWGSTYLCSCGEQLVSPVDIDGTMELRGMDPPTGKLDSCPKCSVAFTSGEWSGHEIRLMKAGFSLYGCNADDQPFEIPGQGLGVFTCRKDAWLGFNPHARGFGGEELYIHEKFRRNGGKAICLPFLQWLHRFGRPDGTAYPVTLWNKVRNYVLEFNELEMPLDDIKAEFVDSGKMTLSTWQYLVKDPVSRVDNPESTKSSCGSCGKKQPEPEFDSVDAAFDSIRSIKRDINEHMPKLRELASQVEHVTEFSERRESTIAFLSGNPKKIVSHNVEFDATTRKVMDLSDAELDRDGLKPQNVPEIEDTDLLFIDYDHTFKGCYEQLTKYGMSSKRYIVLHDTDIYGSKGTDGGPGILEAVRLFVRQNSEWSIVYHTKEQYGLTVLSCQKQDKPKKPGAITMAANFAKAMASYVASGMENATEEQFESRVSTCSMCEWRNDSQCSICGCFIEAKAKMKIQDCPMAYWPDIRETADQSS